MGGWGEPRTTPNAGCGSTGSVEIAHAALDALDIPLGVLADRVLVLASRHEAARATSTSERNFQRSLHQECIDAGWDPTQSNTLAEEVAHLHEEVSEAFRAWREYGDATIRTDADGKPLGVPAELADVLIGLFYIAERWNFDLFDALYWKRNYNRTRDYTAEGRQLHV